MWRAQAVPCRRLISHCNGKNQIFYNYLSSNVPAKEPTKHAKNPKPRMVIQVNKTHQELPVERSRGRWLGKWIGLLIVGAGGATGYALYDPVFRKKLEANVPYTKSVFDYILPLFETTISHSPVPMYGRDEESLLDKKGVVSKKEDNNAAAIMEKRELVSKGKEHSKKVTVTNDQPTKEGHRLIFREKEAEEAAQTAALESILRNVLIEAEGCLKTAVETRKKATNSVLEHSRQLKKAMDIKQDAKSNEEQWQAVTSAFQTSQESQESAAKVRQLARFHMEKIRLAIKDCKDIATSAKNKTFLEAQELLNDYNNQLNKAEIEFSKAQSEAKVMSDYRELVKKGRNQFKKELESITPDVKLGKRLGGKLTEEELNSLIAHAHRRIEQLQCHLAEYQSLEELHIQTALQKQREEDECLAQALVAAERDRLEAAHGVDREKWEVEAHIRFEQDLRQQLTRQAAAHSDHLAEVLKVQERELEANFGVLLNERVLKERDQFQTEVAGWIARLKGIEVAVEGRAELENIGRKAQQLWLACQALSTSITLGVDEQGHQDDRLKPLAADILAIKEAGNSHPFVENVIASMPVEATERGVWTPEALIERFEKVYNVGRRTTMIDETGGSLFKFLGSYMQALFVFRAATPIKTTDIVNSDNLDTFTILDNAKYALDANDLEQALRFMNKLGGEPRRVASDWIKEARLLLETRQAADALLAHSSAHGLGSLF